MVRRARKTEARSTADRNVKREERRRTVDAEHALAFSWLTESDVATPIGSTSTTALDPLAAIERIEALLGSLDDAESSSMRRLLECEASTVALPAGATPVNGPFDLTTLTRRCLGNEGLVRSLLAKFPQTCRDGMDKLVVALSTRDVAAACRAAMRLRGGSAALGADTLTARFTAVETACEAHRWDVAETMLHEARRELNACAEYVRANVGDVTTATETPAKSTKAVATPNVAPPATVEARRELVEV
ncbi:MAG: Hpt domain-containing protein [Pirellulales bacterium]